ncbi:MAG: winged helix-turn-helix domain-containing protein [Pirellulales bacterium]
MAQDVYDLLHRLDYSCFCPRPRHDQANLLQQQAFIAGLPERLEQIAALLPGKRWRVCFQDEARFGQQGTMTRIWAKTGSRPTAVRQTANQICLGDCCRLP